MKTKHLLRLGFAVLVAFSGLAARVLYVNTVLDAYSQARRVTFPVRHAAVKPAAFFVVLQDASQRKHIWEKKMSVEKLLRKEGITLTGLDRVYPGLQGTTFPGLFIKIVRVNVKKEKRLLSVPYKTVLQSNPHMLRSQKKVLKPGKPGTEEREVLTYFKNGVKTSSRVLSKRVVRKSEERVVIIGSAFALASRYSPVALKPVSRISEDQPKNMADTLKTNSVNAEMGSEKYLIMSATAYTPYYCGGSKSGKTATGIKAKKGVVAVDPRVIPLGTKLYIPGYGYALAADTGGAIKGKRIDLCFNTRKEVSRFGRKKVKVYILN